MGSPLITRQDPPRRYVLPVTPKVAWSARPGKRRENLSRLALLAVLGLQAVLTLRLGNSASPEEATLLLNGAARLDGTDASGLPVVLGAPFLYPFLAAFAEQSFGLEGARALSLLAVLAANALLYATTRQLFGVRPALLGAGVFAVAAPTAFLGNIATYDAFSLLLLVAAVWATVRFSRSAVLSVALAGLFGVLAFAVKFGSGIFLPAVVGVAFAVVIPRVGAGRAAARAAGLLLVILIGSGFLVVAGGLSDALGTALSGGADAGEAGAGTILYDATAYGGLYVLTALFGCFSFWRTAAMSEIPGAEVRGPRKGARLLISLSMTLPAVVLTLYQSVVGTDEGSLIRHVGIGLALATPMAGLGMSRMLGAHFASPQYPILVWIILFTFGYGQALSAMTAWPQTDNLIAFLRTEVKAEGKYLAPEPQTIVYGLGRDATDPAQWTDVGELADAQAVRKGEYDLIVLDTEAAPEINEPVEKEMVDGGRYRLRARFDHSYDDSGDYEIWVKYR
ncbi:glycosyltransferase family 39 protein [Actinocorallia sp. A-T 12471]|uniref:glycosyltransferase family 39 protein n=1 Tax=Actinocorallia sp. A-T 12471 TaxID=3089813 RepID=UPI0029D01401|nr:glycosyltransferase family 39 protein [Actinocorallia sp. A-T 12471]MDX6744726.1 glycosyltransferase family 39 protein [Actinocorallia sp. A-T 12471]